MTPIIPPSGLFYPNSIARYFLEGIQISLGTDAYNQLLRESGLERFVGALPPDNLQRQFDFADFSTACAAIDEFNARQQSRAPVLYADIAHHSFKEGLRAFGGLSTLGSVFLGFQALPINVKVKLGLIAMTAIFTTLSDQHSDLEDHEDCLIYIIHKCPVCWGRHSTTPLCELAGAMLKDGLLWATQRNYSVTETRCHAMGDERCEFTIQKITD